jgi:hypothetical protein
MSENTGPRGRKFDEGEGPALLAQLLAEGGAKVIGSDGKKIGTLKEVGDADFVVSRTLKRDLGVPITHVEEVTEENEIVLDVSSGDVKEISHGPSKPGDPNADFSANADDIKRGPWEITKND